ncbi:hypothetical protein GQ44DRAFT_608896 [Phaeosphaeriaceae sp. PMI808]|nr:hypothetical protein GQ44DRAFT_608896 [Phaeosphaeriaceae sp. PMI808]
MAEIKKSFTFLQDSIPQWLQDITGVEAKVTAMQEKMVRVPTVSSPFAKHTTPSIELMQLGTVCAIPEQAAPSQGAQTDPIGNRKRKTLSLLSGNVSGPSRHRPRTMVVVDYDGDMQKSFELLVRAIGTGRNLLRKAKMEAKMQELAALAGESESEEENEADDDNEEAIIAKISYRPRMLSMRARATARNSSRPGIGGAANSPVVLFDTTDKTLESAQSLCETAAHLVIRDGDCRKELGVIRKTLTDVLEIAKTEAAKYPAATLQDLQQTRPQDAPDASLSSIDSPYKKHFPHISAPAASRLPPNNTVTQIPITTLSTGPKSMEIEVDENDEDEEEDFKMPPVRFTSRFANRA